LIWLITEAVVAAVFWLPTATMSLLRLSGMSGSLGIDNHSPGPCRIEGQK